MIISAAANSSGGVGSMAIGETPVSFSQLDGELRKILSNPSSPFEQVIVQVGSGLHYDALMDIIDVCTRQKLPSGQKLTKLSFVELSDVQAQ